MRSLRHWTVVGVVLGYGVWMAGAADLAEVQKKLSAAYAKHKSISAKIEFTTGSTDNAGTITPMSEGKGELLLLREDGKTFTRLMKRTKVAGGADADASENVQVNDGEFHWILNDMMPGHEKTVVKTLIKNAEPFAPEGYIKQNAEGHNATVKEDKLDGVAVYVIEFTEKNPKPPHVFSTVLYFDAEKGVLLKEEMRDAKGAPMNVTKYTAYKFDEKIGRDKFKVEVPPGAKVNDQTAKK